MVLRQEKYNMENDEKGSKDRDGSTKSLSSLVFNHYLVHWRRENTVGALDIKVFFSKYINVFIVK